jgi:hypothetical protein
MLKNIFAAAWCGIAVAGAVYGDDIVVGRWEYATNNIAKGET